MKFVREYLVPRLIQSILVVWLGITVIFIIPRLMPSDPVEKMLGTIGTQSALDPAAAEEAAKIMREMYGLNEGLFSQYFLFWKRLLTGDFGPSLFTFPTPVIELIGNALPWTVGLLLVTTALSWIIGNILGGLTGYFTKSKILKIVDGLIMLVRPIPYYILALILLILLSYVVPIFPSSGGYTVGMKTSFSWRFIWDVIKHASLPAISLMLLGVAAWHQTMRLFILSVKDDDYIRYAKIGNVKERRIFFQYAMRNAILPQITGLTLALGQMFGGALITEIVFAYPGIGYLLYRAILLGDYNLVMGIMSISIISIAAGILIIDLLYPLFDPRIRLR